MTSSLLHVVLATAGSGDPNIDWGQLIGPIYSTGLVGAMFMLLITETWIVTKKSSERVLAAKDLQIADKDKIIADLRSEVERCQREEIDPLKRANTELQRVTTEKMIPALVQATEVSRAYVQELSRRAYFVDHQTPAQMPPQMPPPSWQPPTNVVVPVVVQPPPIGPDPVPDPPM